MSTILVPPNPVRNTTLSAGSVTISPTSAASAPSGCDRSASSPAAASSGRDDGDELALVGDVERVDAEQLAGAVHHGRHREPILVEQHPEATGLGQFVAHRAHPALVASRIQRVDGAAAINSSTSGLRQAVSEWMSASMARSPRASITAMPWSPIDPDNSSLSPGRTDAADSARPAG